MDLGTKFKYIWALLLMAAGTAAAFAQQPVSRIPELLNDSVYSSLAARCDSLGERRDALEKQIAEVREHFACDSLSRGSHADKILALEHNLYDLYGSISRISAEMKRMEQSWTLENLDKNADTGTRNPIEQGGQNANFVYNKFLKDNLSDVYYNNLLDAQSSESTAKELVLAIQDVYSRLAELYSLYQSAGKHDAEEIFAGVEKLASEGKLLNDSLAAVAGNIFDSKTYLYNYILDRSHKTDIIGDMERDMLQARSRMAEASGKHMYDALAAYQYQKSLLLQYETIIAKEAGLTAAADSLASAQYKGGGRQKEYLLPKIDIEERSFIIYSDIEITPSPRYGASNPIPESSAGGKGRVYRILLGAYPKAQPSSVFKNIYPLAYERRGDKKYYYYAGGFHTYGEAEARLETVGKRGFRNARIVAWIDGEIIDDVKGGNANRIKSPAEPRLYRIEITGARRDLDSHTRELVSTLAPDKEISRAVNAEGRLTFTLGSFDNKETAEAIASQIVSSNQTLNVTIITI